MSEIPYCCISKNVHHSYSDVYASRDRTAYRIGKPDGSPMKMYNVSESEAISIVTHLPEELLEAVKKHYNLVEAAPGAGVNTTSEADHAGHTDELTDDELISLLSDKSVSEDKEDFNVEINDMDVPQLRELAKQLEIRGYSKMTKDVLIAAINDVVDSQEEIN